MTAGKSISFPGSITLSPYRQDRQWKHTTFRNALIELTRHHLDNCEVYRNILAASNFALHQETRLEQLPFLPVGIFKYLTLISVPRNTIQRTLTSSGTSRNTVSKIYLDSHTSVLQMQALACILSDFIGKERLPILVVDRPSVLQEPSRAAAVLGFSLYGKNRTFALSEEMQPDLPEIERFLDRAGGKPFLLFGFTYVIWQYLFKYLDRHGIRPDFSQGLLIHGGGWKRLLEHQVSDEVFRSHLQRVSGLRKIYNYYGMMEQTGSIYMQCECGHLHCSSFSEAYVRRAADFSVCDYGEPGIIQTMSALPHSYPGHNLLTEDEGVMLGEDDCPCGRCGKYFTVTGRLINAQLKGCGDTYATS